MRQKKLIWQLFLSFLAIMSVSLLAASLYAVSSIHRLYIDQLAEDLQARAQLLGGEMGEKILAGKFQTLDKLCKEYGKVSSARITIILPTGKVAADSEHNPATMEDHSDRPEVAEALAGKRGEAVRYSYTLQKEMMYIGIPIWEAGKILAVVRLAVPVGNIDQALRSIYIKIVLSGLVIAVGVGGLGLWISRRISRPLEEMKEGAERFGRGELSWRLAVPATREMAALAEGLNSMAGELDDRIRTLMQQRNEQEAVLSSMAEGVLAVDADERVISINAAGATLLDVAGQEVQGRSIQEVVRNRELQEFVGRALSGRVPVEGDIVLRDHEERYLQVRGTVLHDGRGERIGAVIVLNDVTRLHRLETVRRDFVANVSHELKTPITSIKGFVETLLDGAMKNPEDAERFMKIVARQTDRLNAIIEDILTLSRMEDQTEKDRIQLEKGKVKDILKSAIQLCELKAKEKGIRIDLSCDEGVTARMNGPLLEQAVVNLIDNAIKYSEAGKDVKVEAAQGETEVMLHVRDRGCGIEKEHLPRIFERFYRVDKARSRKLGGTGLGLAIVKHITLAHGGTVTIQSVPGQGSTFTIHLPAN